MRHGCCVPPRRFLPKAADGGELSDYQTLKVSKELLLSMGYDFIETHMNSVMSLTEKELACAKDEGLTVNSYNCFFPGTLRITDLSDEIFGRADEALRRASLLGGRCVVFGSGDARKIPEGMSFEEGMKRIETFLTELDKLCDKHNIIVAIEPLFQETTILRYVSEVVELLEKLRPKNIFALADVYHMYMVNEDLNVLQHAAGYLRHIHISEPVNRGYPGCIGGEYLMEFADKLHKIGYDGDVTVECSFTDFDSEAPLGAQFMKKYF